MPIDKHPKCNYIECFCGMGLAGQGRCIKGGEWWNPECPKFKDEDEWIEENSEANSH